MNFKCPKCKKILNRDMRFLSSKHFLSKKGYESYCETTEEMTFSKPIT